jgi:signal transduction histidine kinase
MILGNLPIRRRLTAAILLTSVVVMVLMSGPFVTFEYLTFRQTTIRQITTLGKVTAANSTSALAFENQADARDILGSLAADSGIVAACLYDRNGRLFSTYPEGARAGSFPARPGPEGYAFDHSFLAGFQPVAQGSNGRLGTLYLRFDTGAVMAEWLRVSLEIGAAVMAVILLVAYLLSRAFQRQISQPILELAGTAGAVSERRDYSVRAKKQSNDEIGLLTDAFNQMLARIQELNGDLERRVLERTAQLEAANRELDRSRGELKNLFESLPGLYMVLTPDLKIVAASDAYLKATMTTREGIVGRDVFDVFPDNPNDPNNKGESSVRASFERVLRSGMPDTMAITKYDVRTPEGVFEEHYWSPINSPLRGTDGRVQYIIHRVEEVTDFVRQKSRRQSADSDMRVRLERMEAEIFQSAQRVQATNRQLEAANKELEAFSYSVSHDLRAPLRHIDGFAGLLAKHANADLDEKGRRFVATISGAARQMGRLIDDLLAFSRAGRTDLNIAWVDQDALVEGVIREGHFDRSGRTVRWRVAPLARVRADAAMLRQVWSNLIENAVKYSGKNPNPEVEIGGRLDAAGHEHVFFVRDNGVGFNMSYVDKLFGVFQRLHAAADFEGTGIGLANVRRIVARHGGRTWAEGAVGKGATFYFSLPETKLDPEAAGVEPPGFAHSGLS